MEESVSGDQNDDQFRCGARFRRHASAHVLLTREVSLRSRFNCRGWTWITRKSDGRRTRVLFESLPEILVIHMFATLPNFADLIEQPFEVACIDAMGRPRRHRVDQLVTLGDGKMFAITVKPKAGVRRGFREELAAVKRDLTSDLADDLKGGRGPCY